MRIQFITHEDFLQHDTGVQHPENAARLTAIRDHLIKDGIGDYLDYVDALPAEKTQLERVHDPQFVDAIFALAPSAGKQWIDQDTVMSPGTLRASLLAAGAVVQGVEEAVSGIHRRVFCSVRPPGHHAEYGKAMGFCIFNNVAVGAIHALDVLGLDRIAIIDFDVHHGNGTEDILSGDDRVLYFSSFQHPLFPLSGTGFTADNVINSPLPSGMTGDGFRSVVSSSWLPRIDDFEPELLLVSAGFDAHALDPLGGLNFSASDYVWITEQIVAAANKHADGRIVSVLEGGYNLSALGQSVAAHLKAML